MESISIKQRIANKKAIVRGNIPRDPVADRVGGRILFMSNEEITRERAFISLKK